VSPVADEENKIFFGTDIPSQLIGAFSGNHQNGIY